LVQGLVINRFSGDGISLITNGNNTIKCNRIGTNVAGNADLGNGANGLLVSSSSFNTIQNNTISGNSLSGIRFVTASDNIVQGNIIGLSSDGLTKIPNSGGIAFFTSGSFNVIGGTTAAKRNIISGNNGAGISLRDSNVSLNTIQGNFIGVNPSGSGSGFGNTTDGIQISLSSANNFIGGTSPGAGNVIAFNGNRGVVLVSTAGAGNQIRANSIHSNGTPTNFIGIDLNADGITTNDTDDPDTGANNLQNFPVITDAASYAAGTVISGILNSTANTSFDIDFFSNPSCDALGNGEGETYLGSISILTNAGGDASFTTTVNTSVLVGQVVTATATRSTAPFDTSEFSACRTVTAFAPTPLIVTNTNNSGSGSLRLAITTALANPDVTVINFNIPGAGVHTITLTSPLPPITETTIIDGLSQPGASCSAPLIELDGTSAGAGAEGIVISAGGNSVIKGLIINRFDGDGIEILNSDNNVISCNRIGTNSSGTTALGNGGYGVFANNANNNTIGGVSSNGNLISGNGISGVHIQNGDSNKVQGNIIGLNVAGSGTVANTLNGVHVLNCSSSLIGGASSGARNIISGNTATGIVIESNGGSSCTDNIVQGNFIGTNFSGNAAAGVGNSQDGLRVSGGQTTNTLIGGSGAGEGNVISNNAPFGIRSLGGPDLVIIKGNFIGTNSTGTADAGNVDTGIGFSGTNLFVGGTTAAERNIISGNTRGINIGGTLTTGTIQGNYIGLGANGSTIINNIDGIVVGNAAGVLIGGTTPGAGNVISGNNQGISITSNYVTAQGNLIGTDSTGTLDKGNSMGVFIDGSNNLIGGTTSAARNVISGNGTGILLQDIGATNPITNNTIKNNFIGTDAGGTNALGNSSRGIFLVAGDNNSIGGSASEGNLIAFNNGSGVIVGAGTGNRITANSIFSNGFAAVGVLGIDLGNNGVTANDNLDGDTGANNQQNFPVITSSTNFGGTSINIQGTLNSTANALFQIDFYSNTSCDPSGNGEGQTFIGSTNVTTNGSGNASFNTTFNVEVPVGRTITATATDSANNTSEFSACNSPTAVEFISAQAKGYDNGVLLEWQTGMEIDNLGFNLYRMDGDERQLLNQSLIAGSALTAGQNVAVRSGFTYQWWDTSTDIKNAQYWIEAVDLSGKSDWYGPFFVQIEKSNFKSSTVANASLLSHLQNTELSSHQLELKAKPASLIISNNATPSPSINPAAENSVKLAIKREGFYRITQSELAAIGFDINTDPRKFQLFADGHEQAINIIGEEDGRFDAIDAIEFYGLGIDSPYSDSHTYWIVAGKQPGLRINKIKSPARLNESSSFPYTTERQDKLIYFAALLNGERENFFGSTITAQPLNQTLTVQHLDFSAAEQPILEVTLQGVTQALHNVVVQLNGSIIGSMTFNGLANVTNRFALAASQLSEGVNSLILRTSGAPTDVSLVDSTRLTYSHRYIADNDSLRCVTKGGQLLTISGFSNKDIRIFDISNPAATQELFGTIEEQNHNYSVSIQVPGEAQRTLLAVSDENIRKAESMSLNIPSNLHEKDNVGQFVIITSPYLQIQANQLKTLRQAQGLPTLTVNIEDIYDEFTYGNKSPYAIKAFLELASKEWRVPIKYVLLFGDGSYDEKHYLGSGEFDLVPTKLIDTSLLETACDDWFTDFNNDGLLDIAIGRLPVRTSTEADVVLQKIKLYENSKGVESVLSVADQNEGYDFESASDEIQTLVPQHYQKDSIKRGQLDDVLAKTKLLEAIRRGQMLVSYSGHGSVTTWRGNLLTNADVNQLKNGQHLPLFVMMDCLNGYFHDPQTESLSEALMKESEGGAIAVWASTALTYPISQIELHKAFYKLLFGNRGIRLGDAVIRAKASVRDTDVRRTWTLFADPTMRLR
jgi:parallel beta-helix repeat protein